MQNDDIHSSEIDESLFEIQLDVPDTSALKSRVLQLTEQMPQKMSLEGEGGELAQKDAPQNKVSFLSKFLQAKLLTSKFFEPKLIASLAVAASLALVAVLWIPSAPQSSVDTSNLALSDSAFTIEDDLDFEETMLFFDEQMFAQL